MQLQTSAKEDLNKWHSQHDANTKFVQTIWRTNTKYGEQKINPQNKEVRKQQSSYLQDKLNFPAKLI